MYEERPEIKLLLQCARTDRLPETTGRIVTLLGEEIDWEYLLRTASRHGMVPLLYWQLSYACSEAVPEEIMNGLENHFRANHLRSLFLTGELVKLVRELEANDTPVIPYKGAVLATLAYGNLALREFQDLDFLIRREDFLRAGELLNTLGYRSNHHSILTREQETRLLRYARDWEFTRDDGSVVELHSTVTPRAISFLLDPNLLWERAERISLGGGTVMSLSTEDLLLTLCVHGSAHCWDELRWICDIAEMVRTSENIDWETLLARACAANCKRMLILGLVLSENLLEVELPEKVRSEIREDPMVKVLATMVRQLLLSDAAELEELSKPPARRRFHLRMMDRPKDKIRYYIRRMVTPAFSDWEFISLPTILFPLYRLIRPFRLSRESIKRLVNNLQWFIRKRPE